MSTPFAPWRLAFQLLTADEQRARVIQLHRYGWKEGALVTLSGWSLQDVRRVLAKQTEQQPCR